MVMGEKQPSGQGGILRSVSTTVPSPSLPLGRPGAWRWVAGNSTPLPRGLEKNLIPSPPLRLREAGPGPPEFPEKVRRGGSSGSAAAPRPPRGARRERKFPAASPQQVVGRLRLQVPGCTALRGPGRAVVALGNRAGPRRPEPVAFARRGRAGRSGAGARAERRSRHGSPTGQTCVGPECTGFSRVRGARGGPGRPPGTGRGS